MKRSLFLKIFFSYLVILFCSFFILNIFIKDEIREVMTGKIEAELLTEAELIDLGSARAMSEQMSQIAKISGARVTLVDAKGQVFADSEKDIAKLENHFHRPEIQEARLKGKGRSTRFSQSLGVEMLYVAIPIKDRKQAAGYVRLARPLHDVQKMIDTVYSSIFLTMMIVSVVSLIVALFISYKLARPIRMLEHFTERLRQGEPRGSILLKTSDETKTLADNINYLVEELQSKIRLANEEKSKLMTALTSINEGVLILNTEGKIELVSPSLAHIVADQFGDVGGKTLMEAFRNVELQRLYQRFKHSPETAAGEITLGSPDPVIMNVSFSEVHGYPGEEKDMIVFHDVTRLKKLERIRTDFVANVTHEIRTPLTAVIGYLETLQSGALENTEDARRFIDIILKQARRLNRLVEDLMTISKIELGEIHFRFEDVSLPDVIAGVLPLVEAKAQAKKIRIENGLPEKTPPVSADRDRLSQVFVNVLDNAVKFTPESGRVTIDAEEKDGYVVATIEDTGAGIPREEIQRLGERFYRVDKTRSRELGGTGLGLSIVKHLMLAHGGKMEIESQLGRGTKVSLFFPMRKR
ncbi:MAG TPA: ATP-binding protein [Smithellaceae bacterium]|nr:ATP-binding protein [Smithellaceae bacterium]HRS83414.1 ATP-binding protein [Smithellaceae bacterium]